MTSDKVSGARRAFSKFRYFGDFVELEPYGSGHINDTYAVTVHQAGTCIRYLLQRINHNVFQQPDRLMDNIDRVCRHQQSRLTASKTADASRRSLSLIPTGEGAAYHRDEDGNFWRVYLFIERAVGYDIVESAHQCREAARAFGEFQKQLSDLPGEPLFETIEGFHDTPRRFQRFLDVVAADPAGRGAEAIADIKIYRERETFAKHLVALHSRGELPVRVTHNDTKLNNVLLDDTTGEATCVIDLDTTMPGFAAFDFGDLLRTSTSPVGEDEKDCSLVTMQMPMFEAATDGYVAAAAEFLTAKEAETMIGGGMLMTYENGMRFLTDYLEGDVYYKTKYAEHNLVRCRTQAALLKSMESQRTQMEAYFMKRYEEALR